MNTHGILNSQSPGPGHCGLFLVVTHVNDGTQIAGLRDRMDPKMHRTQEGSPTSANRSMAKSLLKIPYARPANRKRSPVPSGPELLGAPPSFPQIRWPILPLRSYSKGLSPTIEGPERAPVLTENPKLESRNQ